MSHLYPQHSAWVSVPQGMIPALALGKAEALGHTSPILCQLLAPGAPSNVLPWMRSPSLVLEGDMLFWPGGARTGRSGLSPPWDY